MRERALSHVCVYFCRCVAICSLGLWVCEELGQQKIHHQVNDAINVLGVTLKVSVSSVTCSLQTNNKTNKKQKKKNQTSVSVD